MTGIPRFGVVVARFNAEITGRLLGSFARTIKAHGIPERRIEIVRVPGSYDIPWAVQEMAMTKRFDAIAALGAIIRGQTSHNEHIGAAVFRSIQDISLKTRVPCVLGIITPNTHGQALDRTRGSLDRGREAAEAALALAKLKLSRPWNRPS